MAAREIVQQPEWQTSGQAFPGQVPTWMAIAAGLLATFGIAIAALGWGSRSRSRRPASRAKRTQGNERLMLAAALIPTIVVWLAVLAVSFTGLTGFARDTMHWNHWTNLLVPLSLDGISVSFGGWAFVAVKRRHHPGRAYKIVLCAATLSATLNFVHGRDTWSILAGTYLAFLSLAAMVMFREMLDQFMTQEGDDLPHKSRYPHFGQRWIYAPLSTMKARRAWIVHPPDDNLKPTIRNALNHSNTISKGAQPRNATKRASRASEPEVRPSPRRVTRAPKQAAVSAKAEPSLPDERPIDTGIVNGDAKGK